MTAFLTALLLLLVLCAALMDYFLGSPPIDKHNPSMLYGHLRARHWRALLNRCRDYRAEWALDQLPRMDRPWLEQSAIEPNSKVVTISRDTQVSYRPTRVVSIDGRVKSKGA